MARQQGFASCCAARHRLLSAILTCEGARKHKAVPITPWVAFLRGSPQHPCLPQHHESTLASPSQPHRFPLLLPLHSPLQLRICCCKAVSRLCKAAAGLAGLRTFASGNYTIWPYTRTQQMEFIFRSPCVWHLDFIYLCLTRRGLSTFFCG